MKEFKLDGYVKFLAMMFIAIVLFGSVAAFLAGAFSDIAVLCIWGLLVVFLIYLVKVLLALKKDIFQKVAIDEINGTYLLTTKNKEVLALSFDSIESINMAKGEVLRGILAAHVTFVTKDKKAYGLTISKIDEFYVKIPDGIQKNLEEATFYQPRWNVL